MNEILRGQRINPFQNGLLRHACLLFYFSAEVDFGVTEIRNASLPVLNPLILVFDCLNSFLARTCRHRPIAPSCFMPVQVSQNQFVDLLSRSWIRFVTGDHACGTRCVRCVARVAEIMGRSIHVSTATILAHFQLPFD